MRGWNVGAGLAWPMAAAAIAVAALLARGPAADGLLPVAHAQAAGLRRSLESLVVFELTQNDGLRAASADQLTLVFSDRPVNPIAIELRGAPAPAPGPPAVVFGDEVVAEFSFSGLDFKGNRLRFSRRVRDRSFLDARYLRIVNHGGDAWEGRTLSMWVDGAPVLESAPLTPLSGPGSAVGIQNWNARNWSTRRYWELELKGARAMAK